MLEQQALVDEAGKYSFRESKDWAGTGRTNLHRPGPSSTPHGAVTYYSMRSQKSGETVGEIFHLEVKNEIEVALACVHVLESFGIPTKREELEEYLKRALTVVTS